MTAEPTRAEAANSPEELMLLLKIIRSELKDTPDEHIFALIRQGLDWPLLMRLAMRHYVVPLLHRGLSRAPADLVPKPVMEWLFLHFFTNTRHNTSLNQELMKVLELFKSNNIKAVPFKGPALAVLAYGDLLLRQFSDIDILVQREDLLKAKDLLLANGHRLISEPDDEEAFIAAHHHFQFTCGRASVMELQWGFAPKFLRFPIDFKTLWNRLEPLSMNDTAVLQLSLEDLLLVLCGHGAKHGWRRLAWISDVAALVNRHGERIDWEKAIEYAARTGGLRLLLLGLHLAHVVLELDLPEEVQRRIGSDKAIPSLTAVVCDRFASDLDDSSDTWRKDRRFFAKARERLRDKIPYAFFELRLLPQAVFVPQDTDRVFLPLPRFLTFLYYVIRPLRLAGKYGCLYCRRAGILSSPNTDSRPPI